MEYRKSRMCILSEINYYFFKKGGVAPGISFVGGDIVDYPRNTEDYWIIGTNGLLQVTGNKTVMAGFNKNVAEMIRTFA